MKSEAPRQAIYCFGLFEVDYCARELRKKGSRIRLQQQPFEVLIALLERPSEVVTRHELRERLWPATAYLDFDHRLNNAITSLREALGDSSTTPRFIETVPRVGYRFVCPLVRSPAASAATGAPLPAVEITSADPPVSEASAQASPTHSKPARLPWASRPKLAAIWSVAAAIAVGGVAWLVRAPTAAEGAASPIRSVIVLPFEDLSADRSQDYFADAMTDSLITDLAQITSLQVISRTTAMHYKGVHPALSALAQQLRVDAVIEGTVVREGQRVRLNARLIRAVDDRHLWARSYNRDFAAVMTLQGDLAQAIADAVATKVEPVRLANLVGQQATTPAAYDAYLRGMHLLRDRRTKDALAQSVSFFEAAIAADPSFGAAYAGLSESYDLYDSGVMSAGAQFAVRALAAAQRAVELSPRLAQAWLALGQVQPAPDCVASFEHAVALSPGDAWVHKQYSNCLEAAGRHGEALERLRVSLRLDPLNPYTNGIYGEELIKDGHYEEGMARIRNAVELDPQNFILRIRLGCQYRSHHQYEQAIDEFRKAEEISPRSLSSEVFLADALALAGRTAEAEGLLRTIVLQPEASAHPSAVAMVEVSLHHRAEALAWLERAVERRESYFFSWPSDGDWLQSDPQFKALAARMEKLSKTTPGS